MTEESLFAAAIAKSPAERKAFLDESCRDNAELRAAVEELLSASHAAGSFFEHPPAGLDVTVDAADQDTHKPAEWDGSLAFLKACDKPGRIGKLVGNSGEYEIIEVVGSGGMGIVLRAFDAKLSRVVAVKVLAPELARNPTAVKRFLREAKAAAAVVHDHVVTIHNVEETHQPPFLVMQFVDGQTLQQKIDRGGALELKEILRIGTQAAAGLAAAHKHGLVHRDVKPANILLENGVERVKITDFGLARAADDVEITQTGLIAGTPQYMSPEQAKGESLDARSDLFSLGSVLYTMVTGRPAFRADTTMGVIRRVCDDQPRPIHEVNAEVPPWLEGIVSKLLAKDPSRRFQSAPEVSELLAQCLAHVQNPASAPLLPSVALLGAPPAAETKPLAMPAGRTRRTPSAALVVLLGIGLMFAALAAMGIASTVAWYFHAARGVEEAALTLLVAKPTVEVTLNGEQVAVTDEGKATIQVPPGTYHIQTIVRGMPARSDIATLRRGGQEMRRIRDDAGAVYIEGPLSSGEVIKRLAELGPPLTSGWTPLFNGQDLSGWQPHPDQPGAWTVKDNMLMGRGANHYLYTTRDDYQDFRLRAEVKINAQGDSGILVRMAPPIDKPPAESGYEVQLAGDPNHVSPTASIIRHGTNVGRQLVKGRGDLIRPDRWLVLEIAAIGGNLSVAIDGREILRYRDDRPRTSGHIALQSFADATEVSFRKIEIQQFESNSFVIAGAWESDWGRVSLEHGDIAGGAPVTLRGSWRGSESHGKITTGVYDPSKGTILLSYLDESDQRKGTAELHVLFGGQVINGVWEDEAGIVGGWSFWQPGQVAANPKARSIAGRWGSNWGEVSLDHDPIVGRDEIAVRGSYVARGGVTKSLNNARYNPVTGILRLNTDDDGQIGFSQFALSPDGGELAGVWANAAGQRGTWTMTRLAAAGGSTVPIMWGSVRDGWQVGLGWKNDKPRSTAADPFEFELKLRNTADAEKTIRLPQSSDWDLWYSGGNELTLRILGGEEQDVKFAPHEERTIEVRKPQLVLSGLAAGAYSLGVTTGFSGKNQRLTADNFGFHYDGPAEPPFPAGDKPLSHPDAKFAGISWGKPVLGLSVGIRAATNAKRERGSDGADDGNAPLAECEFFLWNTGPNPADVTYIRPHPLDWQPQLRDKGGKEFHIEPILTGPKTDARTHLDAGQAISLGTTTLKGPWLSDRVPQGPLQPGPYQVWSDFNCRRLDYGHLHLRITSGEASIEIKP